MLIVPEADLLTVEAKVSPQDTDQFYVGQPASLRFTAFNQRTGNPGRYQPHFRRCNVGPAHRPEFLYGAGFDRRRGVGATGKREIVARHAGGDFCKNL